MARITNGKALRLRDTSSYSVLVAGRLKSSGYGVSLLLDDANSHPQKPWTWNFKLVLSKRAGAPERFTAGAWFDNPSGGPDPSVFVQGDPVMIEQCPDDVVVIDPVSPPPYKAAG